ncbi:hypothetical protein ASPWEDRAFT_179466 [Aspergillus wentii DTO 134E9]|uniref:Xylose isomerase-like TIM barrel domain-containing protein n=1 Tax=Aspergillus wentii DTO 134E9 TaxID=1073089 RepID=A0A1L9S3M7_ASPWE|nr:uncharacterized protein ASPWEDRAFT_179466 [Aspergillus wentii DTO 134E9]KAI9930102.1 hypothetical protein MW887_011912 [Aspergillus wentii]OJJ41765.1 hypothetical protein ASPWEDRAFT_179466 [Aspergillus wentii DTO 134E9]
MLPNKLAISSISLSQHPSHKLDTKIRTAAQNGYSGMEIVYSELKLYADSQNIAMLDAADKIKTLCAQVNLDILSLAPFENFEGHNSPIEERLAVAKEWIDIARRLGTPYLQVPSQYSHPKDCTGDEGVIVSELRQLADLCSAQAPIVSVAYEALSWGTYCSTWESSLEIVQKVDRPNFGLCLDTFHVVTKLWADPFSVSGKFPNADADLAATLRYFVDTCPLEKIFYVQLSDGEWFDPPFSAAHPWFVDGEAAQFTWSKHARPFPGETQLGGYMPVSEIARTWLVEKGFTGYVSMEIFDRRMRERESRPDDAAKRGVESWKRVQREIEALAKL